MLLALEFQVSPQNSRGICYWKRIPGQGNNISVWQNDWQEDILIYTFPEPIYVLTGSSSFYQCGCYHGSKKMSVHKGGKNTDSHIPILSPGESDAPESSEEHQNRQRNSCKKS